MGREPAAAEQAAVQAAGQAVGEPLGLEPTAAQQAGGQVVEHAAVQAMRQAAGQAAEHAAVQAAGQAGGEVAAKQSRAQARLWVDIWDEIVLEKKMTHASGEDGQPLIREDGEPIMEPVVDEQGVPVMELFPEDVWVPVLKGKGLPATQREIDEGKETEWGLVRGVGVQVWGWVAGDSQTTTTD